MMTLKKEKTIRQPGKDKGLISSGLILVFFVVASLVLTWPLLPNITHQIAGETDAFQLLGNVYNSAKTWEVGSLFNLSGVFQVFTLGFHLLIFHFIFGEPLGYNLFWLLSFVLTGWGTYLLVHSLTKRKIAAIIAGIIFAYSPVHFAFSAGFHGMGHLEWFPFAILFLIKFFQKPTFKYFIGFGVFFTIIASYDIHGAVFMGLFSIVFGVSQLIRRKNLIRDKRFLIYLGIFLALALLFLINKSQGLIKIATSENNYLKPSLEEVVTYSNDAAGFIIPYAYHPIWGNFFWQKISSGFVRSIGENTNYIGIVVLVLAGIGFLCFKKEYWAKFWLGIAILFSTLSLGPFLKAAGVIEPKIPAPYLFLYHYIPFLENIRGVGRFFALGMLGFSILAGYGFIALLDRLKKFKGKAVILTIVPLLLIVDFLAVPRLSTSEVPLFYLKLAGEAGDFSILQTPSVTSYNPSSLLKYYNSQHDKKVLAQKAYFSRDEYDESRLADIRNTPVLGNILYYLPQGIGPEQDVLKQDYRAVAQTIFKQNNLKYIILHKNFITDNSYIGYGILPENFALTKKFIEVNLPVTNYFEDSDTLVYRTNLELPETQTTYLRLGDSWKKEKNPVTWAPYLIGQNESTIKIQNNSTAPSNLKVTMNLGTVIGPGKANISYQGRILTSMEITDSPIPFTFYLNNIPINESEINISLDESVNSVSNGLFINRIVYEKIDDIIIPDIYHNISAQSDNLSILQIGHYNEYGLFPETNGNINILGHKLFLPKNISDETTSINSLPIDKNDPIINDLIFHSWRWDWKYPGQAEPWNKLYYYLLSNRGLRDQGIGYLVLDKTVSNPEEITDASLYILNTLQVEKFAEDSTHLVYRLITQSKQLEIPQVYLNGDPFSRNNQTLANNSIITINTGSSESSNYVLTGAIINPGDKIQEISVKNDSGQSSILTLEPGKNPLRLEFANIVDKSSSATFANSATSSDVPLDLFLTDVEIYPAEYESLQAYLKAQDLSVSKTEQIYNPTINSYDEVIGTAESITDPLTKNNVLKVKPTCQKQSDGNLNCFASVTKFFDNFTSDADIEAWVKLNDWSPNTNLSFRFIYDGSERTIFSSINEGSGNSPTISDVFSHDFILNNWNSLRITNSESDEFTLSENKTPLFWCQDCVESRILGFSTRLETDSENIELYIDGVQYQRDYYRYE